MQLRFSWLFILLLFFLAGCQAEGSFGPDAETTTPGGDLVRRPLVVSLADLDDNPVAYQNRLIQVTGALLQIPPLPCDRVRGPVPQWALLGEELRLDARGFERIMRLVPEGTVLTVDGFWRLYEGPVGCGKEPPRDTLWYLEVVRLVQPNPLPALDGLLVTGTPSGTVEPVATLPVTPGGTATATTSGTPTATATGTLATPTPSSTPSPTTDGATATPSATLSPDVTPSSTPTPGNTPTASSTPTPGPTVPGGSTPTLPPPTATGDVPGYPPPPSPSQPTATPEPYD